jgi:hypothetical protein
MIPIHDDDDDENGENMLGGEMNVNCALHLDHTVADDDLRHLGHSPAFNRVLLGGTLTTIDIARHALASGGGTWPESQYRYVVSIDGMELRIDDARSLHHDRLAHTIRSYIAEHHDGLSDSSLGLWIDDNDGALYLDCSRSYPTIGKAFVAALRDRQLAIYDVTQGQTIYLSDMIDHLLPGVSYA